MKNPEIRFIDDNIDWQNKKIEDILEPYVEKNTNNYPSVAIGRYGIRRREEIYSKELSKDTTKNKVINKNTLTVGMGSTQIDIGILHTDEHFSVSPAYHTFNILENDSKFIESSFAKNNEKYSKQHMIIGARQGKSVDFPNFLADIIYLPSIEVQQKISHLLTNIEDKIMKQENLVQKLKDTKSALLIKMFPQENQSVPELRFDSFTNDWEQRKLGEVSNIVGGGTRSTAVSEFWDGTINWYTPAELSNQIYLSSSIRKITEKGLNNCSAKMLPEGTVLFTSRAGIGKTAILKEVGCTNQGFQSIIPHKDKLDTYFIYSQSEKLKNYGETVGAGSTFVEVSGKQMAEMNVKIPQTFVEQKRIGTFFETLDKTITLHQCK